MINKAVDLIHELNLCRIYLNIFMDSREGGVKRSNIGGLLEEEKGTGGAIVQKGITFKFAKLII